MKRTTLALLALLPMAMHAQYVADAASRTSRVELERVYHAAEKARRGSDLELAIGLLDHVLEIAPEHAGARMQRGLAHQLNGAHAQAVEDLSMVLKADPNMEAALIARARSYRELSLHVEALVDLDHLLILRQDHATALYERGLVNLALGLKPQGCKDLRAAQTLGHVDARSTLNSTRCR